MNKIFQISFLIIIAFHFGFGQNSALILPLNNTKITFDKKVVTMLNFNEENIDSIKTKVNNYSIESLKNHFSEFSFTNILNLPKYAYLNDSINELIPCISTELNKKEYNGRVLTELNKTELKSLQNLMQFEYVFVINNFQTVTKRPFDNRTFFHLHIEVYDKYMKKIYGGKSIWKTKISKKMYSSAFEHYIHTAIDQFYSQLLTKVD